MKNYAKVGNRKGKPGYRTPSTFRARKNFQVGRIKVGDKRGIENL
ncbi:MAG: hypothetical protein UR62_C0014G0010 [Candidatus Nomurabacteria bacterium GW2011_GWF2_35_12]|uniref:Uncharacterized protein n=2 Tax=Candidatus Nomuraibacteriota TaxID=1752729 RepID=A0A0G0EZX5_9BACT|nr:MAG: hypothetical protein UR62_C0014G0010 [Candidatus Nomurabacteria bacterium GW2011_GWF2_35_12]KKP72667.1 MAG: hypothetical protein UR70_C0005G0008 [Candidatus Nomurabacteria bacterium GW2011_GWB1_35_20]KKP88304.1 MAG: hypothetical protein UR92_C0008G0008 [Candidatus Nomurabacteria bacterium GW2011_GWA2_35_80]